MYISLLFGLDNIFFMHPTTFYSYIHQEHGIIGMKENKMALEVIAQLTVPNLMVVSGPLVIVLSANSFFEMLQMVR